MVRSGNLAILLRNFPAATPEAFVSFRQRSRNQILRDRIIYRTMAAVLGRVIVYGGKGALGSVCVSQFKSQNWVSKRNSQISYFCIQYTIKCAVSLLINLISCIEFH